jgi:DNA modification methylase
MTVSILTGDCREVLRTLPDESVHCVVTSPPYFGLRDYGMAGQLGQEPTPAEFVAVMVEVFHEVRRVLRSDGTLWLNFGDSYAGHSVGGFRAGNEAKNGGVSNKNGVGIVNGLKPKDLIGIPWRVAFALQAAGWWLRQDIIWSKPNPMPESVTDRCTKAHEYIFMLTKSERYHYDAEAIAEPAIYVGVTGQDANGFKNPKRFDGKIAASTKQDGHGKRHAGFNNRWDEAEARGECKTTRNKRSVWEVATRPFSEAHFATFPPDLIEPCIKAGCPKGGTVLDPFGGAGTTGLVSDRLQRSAILIELNPEYAAMARARIQNDAPLFAKVAAE